MISGQTYIDIHTIDVQVKDKLRHKKVLEGTHFLVAAASVVSAFLAAFFSLRYLERSFS